LFTVIVAVPLAVPDVAVIVAVPAPTALTTPLDDTVAIAASLLDQVIGAPEMTLPPASRAVAPNVTVWPTVSVRDDGVTVTEAAGAGFTATVANPSTPSMVAVMTALPIDTAVTTPVAETEATPGEPLVQVTARPVSG
jgi:hypothetical protein